MADDAPPRVSPYRFVPLVILLVAGLLFIALGGHRHLTFAALAENRGWLCALAENSPVAAALAFIFGYAGLAAMSVPGAALFTIAAGFLFGPWLGTAYAVTGATLGATIVFLAARAGLAGLAGRTGPWLRRLETGFRRNGLNYLLVLRLVPIFPFWLVNLAAGAIGLPIWVYLAGTFVGMIPVSFVYSSLGSGLGAVVDQRESPGAAILLRPEIGLPILALAVLVLLPVTYRLWRERSRAREEAA